MCDECGFEHEDDGMSIVEEGKPLPTEEESDKAIAEAEARRDLNDHPPISFA